MSETGQAIIITLMIIGGSPGSTAGGMKTTTLAVLLGSAHAVFRRRRAHISLIAVLRMKQWRRQLILMMYLTLFLSGAPH